MKIVFEWPADMSREEWETLAARTEELFLAWLDAPDERTFQLPPGVMMHVLDMETRPAPAAVGQGLPFGPGMLDPSIVRSERVSEALDAIHDPRKSVWPVLERGQ